MPEETATATVPVPPRPRKPRVKASKPRAPRTITPRSYMVQVSVDVDIPKGATAQGDSLSVTMPGWLDVTPANNRADGEEWITQEGVAGSRYRVVAIHRECTVQAETIVKRKLI